MYETYVKMHYLFKYITDENEIEFRLDMWELHSLCERRKIGQSIGSINPQLKKDELEIEKYITKIKNSVYYKQLDKSKKQSIDCKLKNKAKEYSNWRKNSNIELGTFANIHKSHSGYLYKYASAYTHSESYSIMQNLRIQSAEDALKLCINPLKYCNMFLSLTIKDYVDIVPYDVKILDQRVRNIIKTYDWLSHEDVSNENYREY